MTRFGVLADVHANWHALDAALHFLAGQDVDGFLCAGDLVGYGPLPNSTAARVLSLPGHVVAGNHELIALGELDDGDCTDFARASLRWTREALDADVRQRLAALPRHAQVAGVVALAHGSWDDPQRYVRTEAEAQTALRELHSRLPQAELLIVGHTHEALAVGERAGEILRGGIGEVALPRGQRFLLNPGSVGQSRGGPARARVMILDLERRTASFHSVRYDTRSCRRALKELGLPLSSCHVGASARQRVRHLLGRYRHALGSRRGWLAMSAAGTSCAACPGIVRRVRSVIAGFQRGLSGARRHGPRGMLTTAVQRVRPRVWLDEEHVWYQLDLATGAAPDFGTLELVTPRAAQLTAFDTLPTINAVQAAERVRQGGRPYLVLDDGQTLFACWIFVDRAPMIAARNGWLALPEHAACLEDSVAAPTARGRGIAPLTWRTLADRLAHEGKSAMITKVATDNAPSRRAVVKAGFREVAVMRLRRCGFLHRVDVEVLEPGSLGAVLRERLQRSGL